MFDFGAELSQLDLLNNSTRGFQLCAGSSVEEGAYRIRNLQTADFPVALFNVKFKF